MVSHSALCRVRWNGKHNAGALGVLGSTIGARTAHSGDLSDISAQKPGAGWIVSALKKIHQIFGLIERE